uniref:Uncharacterized protein n=1 Tax=Parascaris univalens TaxID=6257 RepID=A0A914ZJF1_PARUN
MFRQQVCSIMSVIRLILLVLVVEIILTAAERLEASEVDALFETPSSNEQDSDEAGIVSTITSVFKEEIESIKATKTESPSDVSSNGPSKNKTGLDVLSETDKIRPVPDLSDRRSWYVPISGADVIPPAIIPPEPEDTVTEEAIKDPAIAAVGDPRNWHVPISGLDTVAAAIIPPQKEDNSISVSLRTAEVKQARSAAAIISASFLPIFLALYL